MYTDQELQDFYKNYRENISRQFENNNRLLEQQRKNAQASIMSGANKAGMLYSNFPQRSKIQYDMQTYQPAQVKNYETYSTGLDKLRQNIANYYNSIKDIQDQIANLNSMQ